MPTFDELPARERVFMDREGLVIFPGDEARRLRGAFLESAATNVAGVSPRVIALLNERAAVMEAIAHRNACQNIPVPTPYVAAYLDTAVREIGFGSVAAFVDPVPPPSPPTHSEPIPLRALRAGPQRIGLFVP